MSEFEVKDSGERAEFDSGMVRDTAGDKTQWHRVSEGPMLRRWAEHLTAGAVKYEDLPDGRANWTLASGDAEYRRFRESAFRHFMQWYYGERDEDHAAAVFFNVNGAEYVLDEKRRREPASDLREAVERSYREAEAEAVTQLGELFYPDDFEPQLSSYDRAGGDVNKIREEMLNDLVVETIGKYVDRITSEVIGDVLPYFPDDFEPLADEREQLKRRHHELSPDCWCNPRVEQVGGVDEDTIE